MSAVSFTGRTALKEWAAVVKALETGSQILILRKGGVREEGFSAETNAFYFYPTGFHQASDKLKPEYKHLLNDALDEKPPEGKVVIRSFAQIAETFVIHSQEKLIALSPEYVYTDDEIKKKYGFRPGDALTVLAVRVYRLEAPVEIPVKTKYGGCVSWVNLDDPVSLSNVTPVLTESDFNKRLNRIRSILL